MRKYIGALKQSQPERLQLDEFVTVRADGIRDAAIELLARQHNRGHVQLNDGQTLIAYVAPKDSPRHASGIPLCVHALTLEIGKEVSHAGN